MADYTTENIRNITLIGHGGEGKTTLTEAMLYAAGMVDRQGKVEDGAATTDYDPEEIKRGISISAAVAPVEWKGTKINVIDVPGYFDFIGEMMGPLRVVETAGIVVGAVSGLTVGIPGFFLSLEPSRERIKGDFLRNVILRALPGGTAIAVGALLAMHLTAYGFSESMCSTVATWMAGLICALVLWRTCIPLNPRRGAVAAASTIAFVVTAALFGRVFLLDPLTLHAALAVAGLTALGAVLVFGTAAVIRRKGEQLH